jgi:type II secretory pathway pseudopilin PulG
VVLFVLAILPGAFGWFWWAHAVDSAQAAQRAEQAAQRTTSAAFEQRLCTTLGRLAALAPPPGSPADNPSRAYLQQEHAVLAQLGPDVGCKP